MRVRTIGLLTLAVVALAVGGGCGTHVEQSVNGIDLVVDDADGGRIALSHKGKTLVDFGAADVGVKKVDATFDMQFGMFDIEEGPVAFTSPAKLVVTKQDDGAVELTLKAADDTAVVDGVVRDSGDGGVRIELTAKGDNDAVIVKSACAMKHAIGLGAQTHDVDHVGQNVPLWVSEQGIGTSDTDELPTLWQVLGRRHTSYAPVPAFVADNGGAYVLDTTAFARVDLCAADKNVASFEEWSGTWALDVFAGDTPREAQAKMVDHFGRPPTPPPWTFAPWNDAIFGSDNVRAIAQALRDAHIPSSVLWTEDWRGGSDAGGGLYRLDEDWDVDPVLYPDFDQMVDDVNALGFQQMVYFNSFAVQGADIFDDVEDGLAIGGDLFSGPDKDFSPTTLVDLTKKSAVDFVKQHFASALASGVRGWMADFGEWLPVDGATLASGEDPHLVHNRYPVLWQQANRDALDEAGVLDDAVVFERSAHLGSQPLVQVLWTGDQRTSFAADDGLPTVLPIGIGLSTVGFPFVTHDIAGYQSATNDPVDKELFLRWTELGAFTSVMRTHHGTHPSLNVNIFTDADTTAHWKRYADLHIRLYPYLRKLALDATSDGGLPLWVPLPLLFPGDDAVWALKDEVMLGPSLLVAPVVTQGAVARDVVFPSARFAPFGVAAGDVGAVGDVVDGPASVSVDVPLAEIPVFIVAGGIVPMTKTPVDTLVPHAAPSTSGAFAGDLTGLEDTEGDRVVVVGLGHDGAFTEEDGTSYTLEGSGTELGDTIDPAGVDVTGDGVVTGSGFTFTIAHSPSSARVTHVILR